MNAVLSIVRPPLRTVAPVTFNVPAIAVLPVVSATVNALVSTVIPPFAAKAPVSVVTPVTARVPPIPVLPVVSATVNLSVSIVRPPLRTVAPVTFNVPAIAVLPVVSATVNALVSTAIPPLALRAPVSVVTPVTPSVEPTVAALVIATVELRIVAVPDVAPIVNVVADPPTVIDV